MTGNLPNPPDVSNPKGAQGVPTISKLAKNPTKVSLTPSPSASQPFPIATMSKPDLNACVRSGCATTAFLGSLLRKCGQHNDLVTVHSPDLGCKHASGLAYKQLMLSHHAPSCKFYCRSWDITTLSYLKHIIHNGQEHIQLLSLRCCSCCCQAGIYVESVAGCQLRCLEDLKP